MNLTTETMGTSHDRRKGWISRVRDKFHRRQRSATSPSPSIVNNQDAARDIIVAEQANLPPTSIGLTNGTRDPTEVEIEHDTPPAPAQSSPIVDSVPQVLLEPTLADNTQQVISLDSDTPTETWTDVWSIAYHEAIASFSEDAQKVIMQGRTFQELIRKLEATDNANKDESIFRRGLDNLRKPLETVELVLDITTPFLGMEPTAATAAGVVRAVITVAIGICGAASELSEQISTMLDHIRYIDECDVVNRDEDGSGGIHMALVYVYTDLLKFYLAASEIVNSKYYVLKAMASHLQAKIPPIVGQFISHAELLQQYIGVATLRISKKIEKMLLDNKVRVLLGTTKDRDRLHSDIKESRSDSACSWILQDIGFKNWYSAPASKHLLLHGNMGCGKTVTAAYIIDEVSRLNSQQVPKALTCFYYCKANAGDDLVEILSSLILQILDQKGDSLKKDFIDWHDDRKKSQPVDPTQSFDELKTFLKKLVDALGRPLCVVLDGLDELDRPKKLIDFIGELSGKTSPVKFCLTFRHTDQRMNSLKGSSYCIQMKEDAQRDETIVRHMVTQILPTLDEDTRSEIIRELSARANGSAIWIKASIDLIKRHDFWPKEDIIDLIKEEICCTELRGLYAKLFSHITQGSEWNEKLLTKALEILAVAKRPLLVRELKWAVAMQMSSPSKKKVLAQLNKSAERSPVLPLLQPFIVCMSDEDPAESHIRLAHESIRELVLERSPSKWNDLSTKRKLTRRGKLEANLLGLCVEYLMLDEIDQNDILDGTETASADFFSAGFSLTDTDLDDSEPLYYDPGARGFGEFFAYSSCYWMEHLMHSAAESLPSISTIITLTSAKSKRFRNWYRQYCRPDCTVQSRFDDNTDQLDPLVFLSLHGPDVMLQELLRTTKIDGDYFIPDSVETAIEGAISYGEISKLKCLIKHFSADSLRFHALGKLMHRWKIDEREYEPGWDEVFDLVLPSPDQLIEPEEGMGGNELLCRAVLRSCFPVVKKLFQAADRNPALRDELLSDRPRGTSQFLRGAEHQSIGVAIHANDLDILSYLLDQEGIEAHLNHIKAGGHGVLHIAAHAPVTKKFELLVPRLKAQVNRTDDSGYTALNILCFSPTARAVECAKILLTEGEADVSAGHEEEASDADRHWRHPLRQAVRGGSVGMCQALIEHGHADPRVALELHDGEASLLDCVTFSPGSGTDEEQARNILAMLSSFAGIKPSDEVGPRRGKKE
ncbi:hypothetical protein O1611_g2033 [Lasiodiplodia mahajangana]|uniref:Uncharacterized protein n=1 Tax=Lasiodiplodia mahajangana TaxID=1108764 RepID=A0ACC2JW00_9PEZI|nr:hypothetical protein O1611_g2033 [Lasiodiplodia mahajangana]